MHAPTAPDGSNIYRVSQDSWFAKIDWPTRAITGTIRLDPTSSAPAGTQPVVITMNGIVEADKSSVVGKFSGSGIGGDFVGNLFGPQGREIGFAYRITINGAEAYAGVSGSKGN